MPLYSEIERRQKKKEKRKEGKERKGERKEEEKFLVVVGMVHFRDKKNKENFKKEEETRGGRE